MSSFKGRLEIHADRGVIYFHSEEHGAILKIEGLPIPIVDPIDQMIDIRLLPVEKPYIDADVPEAYKQKRLEEEGLIRAVILQK